STRSFFSNISISNCSGGLRKSSVRDFVADVEVESENDESAATTLSVPNIEAALLLSLLVLVRIFPTPESLLPPLMLRMPPLPLLLLPSPPINNPPLLLLLPPPLKIPPVCPL